MVFALSAAPKVWFHALLTDHNDGPVCLDVDRSVAHFHQPAFHCSYDDLVVSSPFLSFDVAETPEHPQLYLQHTAGFPVEGVTAVFLHRESRGPPLP